MKIIDINDMERTCLSAAVDPKYPGYVKVEFRTHHEWFTIAEFKQKNPLLSAMFDSSKSPAIDIVGIVSSATNSSLHDKKQRWAKDEYTGYKIWISRGLGEGQVRYVKSNEKSHVFIDKDWDILPNKSSQYVISMNIHDVQIFGNTLPSEDIKALEKQAKSFNTKKKTTATHKRKKK